MTRLSKGATVVLLSGGLDSTTLLYHLRAEGHPVLPISIWYGQRHARELVAARAICAQADVQFMEIDLRSVREVMKGSSQTDPTVDVPEGHYSADNMAITVIPN